MAGSAELSAGFRLTTNNRMEILGCIAGLRGLKECCDVTIYSDSKYVVKAMTKLWALKWRKQGWKRKDENGEFKDIRNPDLWAQMLELCDKHRVRFSWVRGHSGNEGNERCDRLARAAAAAGRLGIDVVYENASSSSCAASGADPPDLGEAPNVSTAPQRHPRNYTWSELMKRVFAADVLACDVCGGGLRILATIRPPEITRKILDHLGLPSRPAPLAPAALQELPFVSG